MGKAKYAKYLASREWAILKKQVHERADGKCERCSADGIDAVHHLTYENIYNERLEDLQAVCKRCHEFLGGKTESDPIERTTNYEISQALRIYMLKHNISRQRMEHLVRRIVIAESLDEAKSESDEEEGDCEDLKWESLRELCLDWDAAIHLKRISERNREAVKQK